MSELYLIAHKVHGEPAFDVATQITCAVCKGDYDIDRDEESLCTECDDTGFWWIIPTSGHRAYPYHCWPWDELACDSRICRSEFDPRPIVAPPMPPALPDHYTSRAAAPTAPSGLAALLAKRKSLNIERRGR